MYKNYEEKIYEGVYEANLKYGISSLTTKIISSECKVSEGSFYRHFESKDDLLMKAYLNIDKEVASILKDVELPKVKAAFLIPKKIILKVVKEKLWSPYFQYFIDNPKKALFYIQYVEVYGDNQDQLVKNGSPTKGYYTDFLSNVGKLDAISGFFKNVTPTIFWTAIIDTTLNFAKKVIQNKIPDTTESRDMIFNAIFSGIISFA